MMDFWGTPSTGAVQELTSVPALACASSAPRNGRIDADVGGVLLLDADGTMVRLHSNGTIIIGS